MQSGRTPAPPWPPWRSPAPAARLPGRRLQPRALRSTKRSASPPIGRPSHYEDGKFWLAAEDMERAREPFQRAGDLMPTFSAAFGNLGATLGELDRPEAALEAFTQALDVRSRQHHHSQQHRRRLPRARTARGVGSRRSGASSTRRPSSSSATTTSDTPCFSRGQSRRPSRPTRKDNGAIPQKNRRQGCRLAVVRFANGDARRRRARPPEVRRSGAARGAGGPAARGLRDHPGARRRRRLVWMRQRGFLDRIAGRLLARRILRGFGRDDREVIRKCTTIF